MNDVKVGDVVERIIKEVNEAKAAGIPIDLPDYVRFELMLEDLSVITFDVPILRLSKVGEAWVSHTHVSAAKN